MYMTTLHVYVHDMYIVCITCAHTSYNAFTYLSHTLSFISSCGNTDSNTEESILYRACINSYN